MAPIFVSDLCVEGENNSMRRLVTDGHCGRLDLPSAAEGGLFPSWANVCASSELFSDGPYGHDRIDMSPINQEPAAPSGARLQG